MAGWVLVACLERLRFDADQVAPGRDRSSDGTIGDEAHQKTVSDHNDDEIGRVPIRDQDSRHEVHALDLDADLRTPGLTMDMVVEFIVMRCRAGAERRLRYVIWNRRIAEASNGWRWRAYTGANPHIQHAHFSASYDTLLEANASTWRLEDIRVALTDADKKWLADQIDKAATAAAERVWNTKWDIGKAAGTAPHVATAGSIVAHIPGEHTRIEKAVKPADPPTE